MRYGGLRHGHQVLDCGEAAQLDLALRLGTFERAAAVS
jgi:hypothetical protein